MAQFWGEGGPHSIYFSTFNSILNQASVLAGTITDQSGNYSPCKHVTYKVLLLGKEKI